jgi:menaquinone-dependent protoporphyrinogen oxidase
MDAFYPLDGATVLHAPPNRLTSVNDRNPAKGDHAMVTSIALVYASRDGQTTRIAMRIARTLQARGFTVGMLDVIAAVPASFDLASYDGAIVASSIRIGKHAPQMLRFVREHRELLASMPNVFLSVSLSAYGMVDPAADERRRARARMAVGETSMRFVRETGWTPNVLYPVAGALLYRQYGFAIRAMMRFISGMVGASTDTSRNHDYTDWPAIERYANELADRCEAGAPADRGSTPRTHSHPNRSLQPSRTT